MQLTELVNQAIPFLIGLLILFGIWAVAEVALTIRRVRTTLSEVDEAIGMVGPLVEKVDPLLERVDPLLERVTLTVDALNLEIMRVDQILEDVEQVTDAATTAANAVSTATTAPIEFLTGLSERIRLGSRWRTRERKANQAVAKAALEQAAYEDAGQILIEERVASALDTDAASSGNTDAKRGVTVIETILPESDTVEELTSHEAKPTVLEEIDH
ncbi:MAG: hypothetical protein HGA54_00265 [Actinobacteria bacterium]|nr:hypothetical protein [Actinomycetota bacterium]